MLYHKKIGLGPDLVLLHGWAFNISVWEALLPELTQHYTVHLVDLPGHGQSANTIMPENIDDCIDQLIQVLPEAAHYIGWSLGGLLAQQIAIRYPDKTISLLLIASTPRFLADEQWPGVSKDFFNSFYKLVESDASKALKQFALLCLSERKLQKRFYSQIIEMVSQVNQENLLNGLKLLAENDLRTTINKIQCDKLYLVCENDPLTPPNNLLNQKKISAVGHVPMITATKEILKAMRDFYMNTHHATYKRNVARSFNRATSTYDDAADLQKTIGLELLRYCEPYSNQVKKLIDIGAGTGMLTPFIESQFANAHCYFIDIAEIMLNRARTRQDKPTSASICADFDLLPFRDQVFDFIYSNMCLQWSLDLNKTKLELLRCLKPGGIMALAFLTEGTLSELKRSYENLKKPNRVNPLYSVSDIKKIFSSNELQIINLQQNSYTQHFDSLADLISYLKRTGANYSASNQPKSPYKKSHYKNQLHTPAPLPATFNVTYILLRKI